MKSAYHCHSISIAIPRGPLAIAALLFCAFPTTIRGDSVVYSHGDPTNFEQYQLELINAARANPAEEAGKLDIDLNEGLMPGTISTEAKQPLAFHPLLLQTARGHSDWMLEQDIFSHTGAGGSKQDDRAKANGYEFSVAENIAYKSTSETPILSAFTLETHDNLFKSSSHRPNLIEPTFSVVGLGLRTGKFREKTGDDLNALMVTQNFSSGGDSIDSGPFLVGVVYNDLNSNGAYDPGEGLPGVRVEPNFGGYYAVTSPSGGYAVPLPPLEISEEDVLVPHPVNNTPWETIRPYDLDFRKSKIESASQMTLEITWSGDGLSQALQSVVTMRRPSRINYKLIGTDNYFYKKTMVSSLNVKADLIKLSAPKITSSPLTAQILNAGLSTAMSVSASGSVLSYQWYQGARGDTSHPVGENSSSFATPSLTANSSYWVRVSNAGGSVDSSESVIVVWPQGIRVGDQFFVDLSPLITGGKTLKLEGKLPTGLKLNTKTWQISGKVTGKAGNFTPSIQVIHNKSLLQTISVPISVGNFPTSLLGNYEALLKGQNGAPLGVFKLTTGKNVWTASLETLGQAKRTAKGTFVLQQGADSATLEAKFAATKTAPAIALNFTLNGNSPFLFGSHNAGIIEGFKMIDSLAATTKPILYNLIMDQGMVDALDKPAGKGWVSGSFAKTGIGTFKGMLGDATAFKFSLRLSVTGQAILWAQPYANKNSFIGGVVDMSDLVPNADSDEALESKISWVKEVDSKTLSYPNGFSFDDLSVSGSRWLVHATHTALGDSLGWLGGEKCIVRIYGAGLSNESQQGAVKFPTEFALDKTFKLNAPVNASTIKWSGSIAKGTGAFSGSFTLPANFSANTIAGSGAVSGLLLQDGKWGITTGLTTGLGLIKVPISGVKGSFRTAAIVLEQSE